jgi:hypothetical protein
MSRCASSLCDGFRPSLGFASFRSEQDRESAPAATWRIRKAASCFRWSREISRSSGSETGLRSSNERASRWYRKGSGFVSGRGDSRTEIRATPPGLER